MSYYFVINVMQNKDGIFIYQEGYAKSILEKINMKDYNSIVTPIDCEIKLSKY